MSHETNSTIPGFRSVPRTGVIYVMNRAIQQGYAYGNKEWSNLGQGAPETTALPEAPERIQKAVMTESDHEYGPVSGITELRQAVADFYNEIYRKGKSSQYTFENVAISGGGRVGLARIAAALGDINLGHFIPDYTAYEELLGIFKAFHPIPLPLNQEHNYHLPAEALTEQIRGLGLAAILASNPCNPTGKFVYGNDLHDWVKIARETHCTFILDEFYSHYAYADDITNPYRMVSAAEYVDDVNQDPVVIIDGLTKNWRYPGWRISWTLAPKEVIEALASAGSFLDGGANHPLQEAALPLLHPAAAQQETLALQKSFKIKRDFMIQRLRDLGFVIHLEPKGAFYIWADTSRLPKHVRDGLDLFEAGLKEKVIVVPGIFFDVNPGKRRSTIHSQYKNYVRVSFGPSMEVLERGLSALERTIQKHR